MDAAGVEVRPIRQMTGGSAFNEVYLDGVVLADDAPPRTRSVRAGRSPSPSSRPSGSTRARSDWRTPTGPSTLARNLGRPLDALERDQVADLFVRSYVQRLTGMRVTAAAVAGRDPGPEASIGKLLATDTMARTVGGRAGTAGPELAADSGAWGTCAWTEHVLGAPGYRIAGGTDEIQRNIVAERVLGLPREARP